MKLIPLVLAALTTVAPGKTKPAPWVATERIDDTAFFLLENPPRFER